MEIRLSEQLRIWINNASILFIIPLTYVYSVWMGTSSSLDILVSRYLLVRFANIECFSAHQILWIKAVALKIGQITRLGYKKTELLLYFSIKEIPLFFDFIWNISSHLYLFFPVLFHKFHSNVSILRAIFTALFTFIEFSTTYLFIYVTAIENFRFDQRCLFVKTFLSRISEYSGGAVDSHENPCLNEYSAA